MKHILSCFIAGLITVAAHCQSPVISVKEFLKLSEKDTCSYTVKGVVTKIRSSVSGSFYLKDKSGTLLVYGLKDPLKPNINFRQLDICTGDTLSVRGRFTIYNGSTKEMKNGRLVSKADGPQHSAKLFDRMDRKPQFKGKEGDMALDAFKAWVQGQIKTPDGALTGTVVVRFVVGRNGKVQEVQVVKGASKALDDEAVRVVRSSPKWKAAKMDGATVRCTLTVPVTFGEQS